MIKKESVVVSVEKWYSSRYIIINAFNDGTFPKSSFPERFEWTDDDNNTPISTWTTCTNTKTTIRLTIINRLIKIPTNKKTTTRT